jgi:hypothetical protein
MTPAAAMAFIGAFVSGQVLRVDGGGQCWAESGGCWFAGRNPSGIRHSSIGLDWTTASWAAQARHQPHRRSFPKGQGCCKLHL